MNVILQGRGVLRGVVVAARLFSTEHDGPSAMLLINTVSTPLATERRRVLNVPRCFRRNRPGKNSPSGDRDDGFYGPAIYESGDDTAMTAAPVFSGDPLGEDGQPFTLKPLVEMGVVGACRRGRRRGRRNRTAVERQTEKEQRRHSKNARERERVENVRNEYAKLEKLVGLGADDYLGESTKELGRYCKLRVLTAAIERIKTLKELLRSADEETGSVSDHTQAPLCEHHAASHSPTVRIANFIAKLLMPCCRGRRCILDYYRTDPCHLQALIITSSLL